MGHSHFNKPNGDHPQTYRYITYNWSESSVDAHIQRERERKREKEQNMIMVQKKLMMMMMAALLAACALATSATAMNTIPTDLVLRKLSWSGGEWSYDSPWGGEWSGSWGDGGSAQSTPPAQYCTCGGCSQHVYLPPGNNYCAPSRQWCYFDVQDNAG